MKKSILSRMLISFAILAFSAAITAGACKKNGGDDDEKGGKGGLQIEIKAGDAKIAEVSSANKEGTKSTVNIVADVAGAKFADNDDRPEYKDMNFGQVIVGGLYSTDTKKKAAAVKELRTLFTAGLKDKTSGIIFSVIDKTADGKTPAFDADTKFAQADFSKAPTNAAMSDTYAYITDKTFSIVSMYLTDGTAFTEKTAKDIIFGMVCTADATDLTKAMYDLAVKVAKNKASKSTTPPSEADLKSKTFKGLEKTTCRAVRKDLSTDATKWAVIAKDTKAVKTRKLLFVGIDTGAATLADLAQVEPLVLSSKDGKAVSANGIDKDTLTSLAKKYPTVLHQVSVNIVEKLTAAATTEEKK